MCPSFPAIYAYVLYADLPGSPTIRGMMGAGMFSTAIGGVMAAMGSFIGHILYGSLLGLVASSREPRVARA